MRRRHKMSKGASRRNFRKGSGVHKKNSSARVSRGGRRL